MKKSIKYDNICEYYLIDEYAQIYNAKTNKMLMGSLDKNGYCRYSLIRKDGSRKTYKAHRLVMITFCPIDKFVKLQVNHIDGNKLNNHISNLEWCTNKENIRHAIQNKLIYKSRAIITEQECIEICKLLEDGYAPRMVAQKLYPDKDINKFQSIIQDIKKGKNWRNVSCNFNINVDYKYKDFNSSKYTVWQIEKICEMICNGLSNKDISRRLFFKYTKSEANLISAIRTKKKYENVSNYYF